MFVLERKGMLTAFLCCVWIAVTGFVQISHAQMSDEDVQKVVEEQQTFFKQVLQETTDQIKVDEDYEDEYGRPVNNVSSGLPSSVGLATGEASTKPLSNSNYAYSDGGSGRGRASTSGNLVYKNATNKDDPLDGVQMPQRVFKNVDPNRF